ncbi:hypothetical protein FZ042_09955 [Listeria monocytogenes]|nr:hypothetical protein FZ042_09955 [Listeria monocytogenes]
MMGIFLNIEKDREGMNVIGKKILVLFLLFGISTNLFSYVTNAATLIEDIDYKTVGEVTATKPSGREGVDYIVLKQSFLPEWDINDITYHPSSDINYVEKGSAADGEQTLARYWKEDTIHRANVSLTEAKKDLAEGYVIRGNNGEKIEDIADLTPSKVDKKISPFDFNSEDENEYPEGYSQVSNLDLAPGKHIKVAYEYLPDEVKQNSATYIKKTVYIRDLYDAQGNLETSKLIGQQNVDWEYTYILNSNNSKKMVTSANLHEINDLQSVAQENGGKVIDGHLYEYWEKDGTTYKKTNWKYIAMAPLNIEFHEHELDSTQDSYNFGVGTINTWYVLNQPNNQAEFQNQVNQHIQSGLGNSGIANGWASNFGFKKVVDENAPLDSGALGTINGPGVYRTTVQQYPLTATPYSEIVNNMIFMDIFPYKDASGNDIYDGAGQPVYQWKKYYYTDKEEYYALERISAYDYGYFVEENKFFTYTADKIAYQTREMQPLYQRISLIQKEAKDPSNDISISAPSNPSKEMKEPKGPAINQSTKASRLVKAGDDTILFAFQGVGVGLICLLFMWRWEKRKKKKSHSSKKSDE